MLCKAERVEHLPQSRRNESVKRPAYYKLEKMGDKQEVREANRFKKSAQIGDGNHTDFTREPRNAGSWNTARFAA